MVAVRYVESPSPLPASTRGSIAIFLAGGITGRGNWQYQLRTLIETRVATVKSPGEVILLNPRRENFPMGDPRAAREQITWEFNMLRRANIISFWFDAGAIQPIALFELGAHSMRLHQSRYLGFQCIYVGVHPDYPRSLDVQIQLSLLFKKDFPIFSTLPDLSEAIFSCLKQELER